MPNKPPIYAHCPAGCEWETVHKSDFESAVTNTGVTPDLNGTFRGNAIAKYRIMSNTLPENFMDINVTRSGFDKSCMCAVGNKIYVFCLVDNTNQVLILDTIAETSEILTIDGVDLSYSCCAAIGNDIYIFGGTSAGSTRVLKFDTSTNTLTTTTTVFPTARSGGCAISFGLYIYICGGMNNLNVDRNIYRMTSAGVLSVAATSGTTNTANNAVSINNGVYYFNDSKMFRLTISGLVEVMTVSTSNELNGAKFVGIGNKIFCFGGSGDWQRAVNIIDVDNQTVESDGYYPSTETAPDCCASVGAYAYMIGLTDNVVTRFNVNTYDVNVAVEAITDGVAVRRYIPITAYDEMRGYFYIEILDTQMLSVTYEENGVRTTLTLDAGFIGTVYQIVIDGAMQVYRYSDTGGLAITVDEWTAGDIEGATLDVVDRTEYRGTEIGTLTLDFPVGIFECWLKLSFAASGTVGVTFPEGTMYIGDMPTFANSETWEISIKDGVVASARVGTGA